MLPAVLGGCARLGEVGVVFLDPLIGVAMAELAAHRFIAGRRATVGFDCAFVSVAVGMFLLRWFRHICMDERFECGGRVLNEYLDGIY